MRSKLVACIVMTVIVLAGCQAKAAPSERSIGASAPVDAGDQSGLRSLVAQLRATSEDEKADKLDEFADRMVMLGLLDEPMPAVHNLRETLDYERQASPSVASLEARVADRLISFDFQWRAEGKDAVLEAPERDDQRVNPLGSLGQPSTTEVRPGIWLTAWNHAVIHAPDEYVIRAIATSRLKLQRWDLTRRFRLAGRPGEPMAFDCQASKDNRGPRSYAYCKIKVAQASPGTDAPLLDQLERMQRDGPQPVSLGSVARLVPDVVAPSSVEAATKPEHTQPEQGMPPAVRAASERLLNAGLLVLYWGIALVIFAMPVLGIFLAKRRVKGPGHRKASFAIAACCLWVAWEAGSFAHPGRSYPDAMGPAGLIDYALLLVAALAGFGGVMALVGALRRSR